MKARGSRTAGAAKGDGLASADAHRGRSRSIGGRRAFPDGSLAAYLAMTPALEDDALLKTLLECAMRVVGAGGAGLTMFDPRRRRLVFRAAIGDGAEGILGQEVPLRGSRHGLAFVTGEVQNDTPLYDAVEAKARSRFRNVLVAPLMVEEEAVGTISAVNKKDGRHFSVKDMAAYRSFADVAAVIVRQRSREQVLRRGAGAAALPPEDRSLLEVFDMIARLRRRHPERLGAVTCVVEAMAK